MHIPGKLELAKRSKKHRFFTQWATRRRAADKNKLITITELMNLPHAQKVAQIAGNARRLAEWERSCKQGNAIWRKRALARLGIADTAVA